MAIQVGTYTVLKKAQINASTGAVTIVNTIIETVTGRLIVDNVPTNLLATIKTNVDAVSGQYDYLSG